MYKTKIFTILLLISTLSLYGQSGPYSDQSTAFQICEFGQFSFDNMKGEGLVQDVIQSSIDLAEFKETNSVWLRIDVSKQGLLSFIIEPDNPSNDIDYMVLEESNNATNNIRSNLSGRSYGAEHSSDNCFSLMGLNEMSNDEYEIQGCSEADDNFLKAVKMQEGKRYYILVNNLASKEGFTINIQTDKAKIAPSPACRDQTSGSDGVTLFPNPAQKEITVNLNDSKKAYVSYSVTDLSGKLILKDNITLETNMIEVDISTLTSQAYILSLYSEDEAQHFSFIKI